MLTLLVLVGLPGSGKTTDARRLLEAEDKWIRVNRDDLRAMCNPPSAMYGGGAREDLNRQMSRRCVQFALTSGFNVVVDDTNLVPKTRKYWRDLAVEMSPRVGGVLLVTLVFRTTVADCIARDAARAAPVGEKVIRRMAEQYPEALVLDDAQEVL